MKTALRVWVGLSVGWFVSCGGEDPVEVPTTPEPPELEPGVDLQVAVIGPPTAVTGDPVQYRISARNLRADPAQDVQLTVTLPADLTATISDGGQYGDTTVTWPIVSSIGGGERIERTIDVEVPGFGPLVATATGVTPSADANPANNDGTGPTARATTIITFDAIRTIDGESAGDQFGWLIEALGDLDGDAVDDFVVTAPSNGGGGAGAGRAYVYSGASGTELFRFSGQAGEGLGTGVDLAGDVDNDGTPDIIVGAPGSASGRAYVYSGATGATLHTLTGENAGDAFGTSVGRLGDVDGDGFADFVVTATGFSAGITGAGRAYVYSGASGLPLVTVDGTRQNGQFGSSSGGMGDVNGDDVPDFAIGAPARGGLVAVFSGADGSALFTIPSDTDARVFGQFWLNGAGDVNGDDVPDLFASDIQNDGAGLAAGRAYLFSGADGSVIHQFDGESGGDGFGIGRAVIDVTGDGVNDVFVAAWLSDEGESNAGKAYVFSGADGELVRAFASVTASDNYGFDAVGIGDLDGDGVRDFLVSGGISATSAGRVYVVAGR